MYIECVTPAGHAPAGFFFCMGIKRQVTRRDRPGLNPTQPLRRARDRQRGARADAWSWRKAGGRYTPRGRPPVVVGWWWWWWRRCALARPPPSTTPPCRSAAPAPSSRCLTTSPMDYPGSLFSLSSAVPCASRAYALSSKLSLARPAPGPRTVCRQRQISPAVVVFRPPPLRRPN